MEQAYCSQSTAWCSHFIAVMCHTQSMKKGLCYLDFQECFHAQLFF